MEDLFKKQVAGEVIHTAAVSFATNKDKNPSTQKLSTNLAT